jgi:hypothetical protein
MASMARTTFETPAGRFGVVATEAVADAVTQHRESLAGDRRELDFPALEGVLTPELSAVRTAVKHDVMIVDKW